MNDLITRLCWAPEFARILTGKAFECLAQEGQLNCDTVCSILELQTLSQYSAVHARSAGFRFRQGTLN